MSGQKDLQVQASPEALALAAAALRERQEAARRHEEQVRALSTELSHVQRECAAAKRRADRASSDAARAQRDLRDAGRAVDRISKEIEQMNREMEDAISRLAASTAGAAGRLAEASAALAEAQRAKASAGETVERLKASAEQQLRDHQALLESLGKAGAAEQVARQEASENLAILAAMSRDPALGALVNVLVTQAESLDLTVSRAFHDGHDWALEFATRDGQVLRLVEQAKSDALEAVKAQPVLAALIGENAAGDDACLASVGQLIENLRANHGIRVDVNVDPDATGVPGHRADRERA